MAKRGIETPSDDQLRIGEYPVDLNQGEDDKTMGLPPHLQLTEKERLRFENAVDSLGRERALLQIVPKAKAEQIIGYWTSHAYDAQLGAQLEQSRVKQQAPKGPSVDELAELFRDVHGPQAEDKPPAATDKAA